MPGARRVDKAWFQGQLRKNDSSQRKLAHHLKLDPSAVTLMFDGDRGVQIDEAVAIAKFLGQPLGEVLSRFGLSIDEIARSARSVVPIAAEIDARGEVTTPKKSPLGIVPAPPDTPAGTVALRGATALTGMDMLDGWLVYYAPLDSVSAEAVGRLCVLELDDGRQVLRFLRRAQRHGVYTTLCPLTGANEDTRVVSASPVLWIQP